MAPGVFSGIVAMLAEEVGFEAIYFSGGAFANLQGMPDLGTTTLTEVTDAVRRITLTTDIPILVDTDTGFGEAVNVARMVREMSAAGAAAVQIEDQVMPKRCGHLSGKELVDVEELVKKIMVARQSSDLVVIARTDARSVEGLDSAIERAKIYVKAGAEVIFPEALETREEFAEFSRRVKAPLLANMTEFGRTPYINVSDFRKLGYSIVIFPMSAFRATLLAVKRTFEELHVAGTQKKLVKRMMTRKEVYRLIDYYSHEKLDKRTMMRARRLLSN